MWLIMVTMTTVGYGDITPITIGGRIIGVIICIWGMFLTSFFTVTLTNYLEFQPGQSKVSLITIVFRFASEAFLQGAVKEISNFSSFDPLSLPHGPEPRNLRGRQCV